MVALLAGEANGLDMARVGAEYYVRCAYDEKLRQNRLTVYKRHPISGLGTKMMSAPATRRGYEHCTRYIRLRGRGFTSNEAELCSQFQYNNPGSVHGSALYKRVMKGIAFARSLNPARA